MRLYLIRHSLTAGNLERRYIGRTDEGLCKEGMELLRSRTYPEAEAVFVSPMKRCVQTAELIYPEQTYVVVEELVPEMSQEPHSNIGTIAFATGFTVMMILDVALG